MIVMKLVLTHLKRRYKMKQTISLNQFRDAFKNMNRADNFSYKGLEALFDYFETIESDCDIEVELDVVAICCEYSEDEPEYYFKQYDVESIDELAENTQVIRVSGSTTIIIQDY